jgi:23S rRNA (guanosine2251-2'-O)-methyltransferase
MSRYLLGRRAVVEALRAAPKGLVQVFVDAREQSALDEIRDLAAEHNIRVETKTQRELDAMTGGLRHQGVVAAGSEFRYRNLEEILNASGERPILVALDEITDPHNFGAIVRSAVAFGAEGVITLKDRAAPVTPVVVRASAGATEHAKIARITNLATTLKSLSMSGMDVLGLDADGDVDLFDYRVPPEGVVLVVGAEGKGLRRLTRERCTVIAKIPMNGPIASLNASVAAGIALAALSRNRS